jgi:hypothetical protein
LTRELDDLTKATTLCRPFLRSAAAIAEPTKPLAPVTSVADEPLATRTE